MDDLGDQLRKALGRRVDPRTRQRHLESIQRAGGNGCAVLAIALLTALSATLTAFARLYVGQAGHGPHSGAGGV